MKKAKRFLAVCTAIGLIVAAVGCAGTDVVGRVAKTSFKAVLDATKETVKYVEEDGAWDLASPEGDEMLFSSDFSRKDTPDAEFSFDASPFIAAGLDIAKLPEVQGLNYELEEGRFMIHFELGTDTFAADAAKSPEAAFAEIVRTQRSRIGYHEKLDHYGISLGNGNMFEWAKDLSKNDKDIVWVLNPEPFIAAGVDPAKIEGWVFAKVETKDEKGTTIFVDKLLKPFNLK